MSTQVNKLREDNNYYGDYGSQWLSNSDVKILLENPENFKKRRKADSNNLIYGSYFHALINEPDKVKDFVVIDSSRRGIKKFNEEFDSERFDSPYEVLLKKEAVDAEELANLMKSKVDVDMPGFIYDLKTTSDIHKFKRSAYIYGYDSQAYIYEKLTGKRFEFLVACKTNKILGRFDCSDEFILSGERKVERAIAVWREYFSEEKTKDINNFYINITL
jgi:hypothetical protein